ncbi:toxin C-terminal domain-containing protein [Paraclostridium bifermentans]|uniref:toxin C-terminal domain-containing protein n=1 Tax=Paraclostridium bifermentans TaxID=1490 RepID=UPI0018ABEC88|nr:toxin C-terminal domain-containing protein [Paraclostridium bifermentans]
MKNHITNKELTIIAKNLGYIKVNEQCHGQAIFYNKKSKSYISYDIDSHNGGFWKKATSIKNLASRSTREGTYDIELKRVGD